MTSNVNLKTSRVHPQPSTMNAQSMKGDETEKKTKKVSQSTFSKIKGFFQNKFNPFMKKSWKWIVGGLSVAAAVALGVILYKNKDAIKNKIYPKKTKTEVKNESKPKIKDQPSQKVTDVLKQFKSEKLKNPKRPFSHRRYRGFNKSDTNKPVERKPTQVTQVVDRFNHNKLKQPKRVQSHRHFSELNKPVKNETVKKMMVSPKPILKQKNTNVEKIGLKKTSSVISRLSPRMKRRLMMEFSREAIKLEKKAKRFDRFSAFYPRFQKQLSKRGFTPQKLTTQALEMRNQANLLKAQAASLKA